MSPWHEVGIIVLLTAFNGVFSGAEIAMLSVRKTRLRELADDGNPAAKAALRLRKTPESLLATIQIGITVIGATTAVFGGARLEEPLTAMLHGLGFGGAAEWLSIVIVIGLVSYLSLVLGELVPKSLALRSPERFALLVSTPLVGLAALARPLVWLLTASSNAILRPFHDRTTFTESRLSPDELQQLVEESAEAGALHGSAGEIASRAIDLSRLRVNALMIPPAKIVAIDVHASQPEVLGVLRSRPHARYPVHEGRADRICGYVLARDVYDAIVRGTLSLRTLVRPLPFYPATTPAIDVLRALQAARRQLCLLADERGAIAGLVTIEDIAEDLFGEILEEHETHRPLAWPEPDATHVALGEAPVHEVSRMLDEDLGVGAAATTMAALVAEMAGRVPAVGERMLVGPRVEAEVLEATPRQVAKVRLRVRREEDGG
jgi:putative hemolysin